MTDTESPIVFRNISPSGIEIEYSPAPRRFYRVNGEEVPSVTSVLGCLDKPLSWYGMTVGSAGVLELFNRKVLLARDSDNAVLDAAFNEVTNEDVVRFLTQQKLTVNHLLTKAGDRGTSVHSAFENWAVNGIQPHPELYPDSEKGYVTGLVKFLTDWSQGNPTGTQTEVMVGSAVHKYAGRFDYRATWEGGEVTTRVYPKRAAKRETLPAGRYLLDAKSSSGVYKSHALQLAGYVGASDECGYEPVDYTAVIHLTKAGEYELVVTTATLEDFLSVRRTYDVLQQRLVA